MPRMNRTVADRRKSLQPAAPSPQLTLAGLRAMYEAGGGRAISCTITGYYRTQIFEFPRVHFQGDCAEPPQSVYDSASIQATVVTDIRDYFSKRSRSKHYALSPPLRYEVSEVDEKLRSQTNGRTRVYLVVEEQNTLSPVYMTNGECCNIDEVQERDGKMIANITGGREGKTFILAWHAVGGSWPTMPDNQDLVDMILAVLRAGQDSSEPIRRYVDSSCFVTDDDQYVATIEPTASARLSTATNMDSKTYRERVLEIRNAIAAMKPDITKPHIALLVNSMYRDEYKNDAFERLHYLRLWESLSEAGEKYLGYAGDIKADSVVVAGKKSLRELKQHRNNIAHWWTDTSDEKFLEDLQRTVNELLRRRYF